VIGWGIIGCGAVCEVKSGPAFSTVRGSSLVSVMRRDGTKARSFAERHGARRHTSDASDVLEDPEVDVVYVATPPGTHAYYAQQAAERGKACYVERPMARRHEECLQMVAAAPKPRLSIAPPRQLDRPRQLRCQRVFLVSFR